MALQMALATAAGAGPPGGRTECWCLSISGCRRSEGPRRISAARRRESDQSHRSSPIGRTHTRALSFSPVQSPPKNCLFVFVADSLCDTSTADTRHDRTVRKRFQVVHVLRVARSSAHNAPSDLGLTDWRPNDPEWFVRHRFR